ncbi:hypothetical protein VTL71DRAFT_10506 [Oculimacula yallundae]|uniref:Uncharacterized protein n=1 Tax=Oculimacula yallundae TaxID=86028 RepID=A0ABR4CTQ7_9HELO
MNKRNNSNSNDDDPYTSRGTPNKRAKTEHANRPTTNYQPIAESPFNPFANPEITSITKKRKNSSSNDDVPFASSKIQNKRAKTGGSNRPTAKNKSAAGNSLKSFANPKEKPKSNIGDELASLLAAAKMASNSSSPGNIPTPRNRTIPKRFVPLAIAPTKGFSRPLLPADASKSSRGYKFTSPRAPKSKSKSKSNFPRQEAPHATAAHSLVGFPRVAERTIAGDKSTSPLEPGSTFTSKGAPMAKRSVPSIIAPTKGRKAPSPVVESESEGDGFTTPSPLRSPGRKAIPPANIEVPFALPDDFDWKATQRSASLSLTEAPNQEASHTSDAEGLFAPPWLRGNSRSKRVNNSYRPLTPSALEEEKPDPEPEPEPSTESYSQYRVRRRLSRKNSLRENTTKTETLQNYDNLIDANNQVAKTWEVLHGTGYSMYHKGKAEDGSIWWAVMDESMVLEKCDVLKWRTFLHPSLWAGRKGNGEVTKEVKEWGAEIIRHFKYVSKSGKIIDMEAKGRSM